ncbi:hypothetical protein C8A05DRAFT_39775 [Staphylotrichum tortipilum]|uniref:Aminoglycoside phosphotransferase domain-containing protein n=1 Tax=Staphylotrichum tortipilum TaxID=2831512 RepID=A0AAN6M8F3_9PEZI|nr:hypothetical protein C8A05DRAFT_39775 [Staphylotrichum longicolle]
MTENEPSPTECGEDEIDELAPFSAVLSVVRLDAVPEAASRLWDSQHPQDHLARPPVVGAPLHGAYNILFPVEFECRGVRWLLKIPINGTPTHWDALSADALESEARTMQLISQRTSVPVPEVFGFSKTPDNPLGCPHMWLSFIPGVSLYDFWFDQSPAISDEDRHRRRARVLQDVADAMMQLGQFSFDRGGRLLFTNSGALSGVGPRRELDMHEFQERLMQDNPDYMPVYFESGPFETANEFYTTALAREKPAESDYLLGQSRLLDFFLDCTANFFTASARSFVLTHPDFDIQNFLISPEGRLVGIIDWDGVGAWPASLGNLRYPGWLTRDWDPGMYGYGSDGILHDPEMREDSPQTLARYRKVYRDALRDALGQQGGNQADNQADNQPHHTTATLITENLAIAVSNPAGRGNILRKIVQEITAVVKLPCGDERFLYMELCESLGQGEVDKEMLDALRSGLEMLLQKEDL